MTSISEWSGDRDLLIEWIMEMNDLSRISMPIYNSLGRWVPFRLTLEAKTWWTALPTAIKAATITWDDFYNLLDTHWMTVEWFSAQQKRGLQMGFRDKSNADETPRNYVTRKAMILQFVMGQNVNEGTIINYILDRAPKDWAVILNIGEVTTLAELHQRISREEQSLMRGLGHNNEITKLKNDIQDIKNRLYRNTGNKPAAHIVEVGESEEDHTHEAEAHFGGSSPLSKPGQKRELKFPAPFPKQDWKKSTGRTPADLGKGPCRHCSSLNHWDKDCPKAEEGKKIEAARKAKYQAKVLAIEALDEIDDSVNEQTEESKNDQSSEEETL
jgi:hypothetical protein